MQLCICEYADSVLHFAFFLVDLCVQMSVYFLELAIYFPVHVLFLPSLINMLFQMTCAAKIKALIR